MLRLSVCFNDQAAPQPYLLPLLFISGFRTLPCDNPDPYVTYLDSLFRQCEVVPFQHGFQIVWPDIADENRQKSRKAMLNSIHRVLDQIPAVPEEHYLQQHHPTLASLIHPDKSHTDACNNKTTFHSEQILCLRDREHLWTSPITEAIKKFAEQLQPTHRAQHIRRIELDLASQREVCPHCGITLSSCLLGELKHPYSIFGEIEQILATNFQLDDSYTRVLRCSASKVYRDKETQELVLPQQSAARYIPLLILK